MITAPAADIVQWAEALNEAGVAARCLLRCGSTMEEARSWIASGDTPTFGFVLAAEQEAGRGRAGKRWVPPQSGFYGTYLWALPGSIATAAGLSLAVGVALAEVLVHYGVSAALKWPNDLLVDDRKLAGILIELYRVQNTTWALIGIGVNLAGEPADIPQTTSIATITGHDPGPLDLALRLSRVLESELRTFAVGGFAPFQSRWMARGCWMNEEVSAQIGARESRGIVRGVNPAGQLLLDGDEGRLVVSSGELRNLRRVIHG